MGSRTTAFSASAIAVLLGAAAIFAAGRSASGEAAGDAGVLAPVSWLAGDWETRDVTPYVEERWTGPAGGAMLGTSRAIKDNKMVEFEFMRLEARADGIFYMPQPFGKPPVDFKFTPTVSNEAVFVNPGHSDHLKKIIYRKNADGTLTARIAGENHGKSFAQEWHYFPHKK
ncbi:MAG TPA: DUF6265 family protein [Candidatus Acidoferrum sp.]|nr:DUF6265 family protein [Candidatus Acidoferrum sp.]